MTVHAITLATIRKHLAEAELAVAVLESRRAAIPATAGSSVSASRVARQIKEAKAVYASWVSVERQASGT
jgi:hypothetical protein